MTEYLNNKTITVPAKMVKAIVRHAANPMNSPILLTNTFLT